MKLTKTLGTKLLAIGLGMVMTLGVGLTASRVASEVKAASKTAQLVTSAASLVAGDKIVIVGYDNNSTGSPVGNYSISITQNGNNRSAQSVTVSSNTVTFDDTTTEVFTLGGSSGAWTLYANTTSGYLYAASSSKNYLRTRADDSDGNSKWAITITSNLAAITAQGDYTRNKIKINPTNSPTIFSCYDSGQLDASIYKVTAVTLSSIAVTTQPTNKTYFNGEYFDPTGMVVTATYSNSTTANVTSSCTYTPSPLTTGTTSVTISYVEGGVTRTTSVTGITVTAPKNLSSISVSGTPSKTSYFAGESFAPAGITITAHYSDSTTANVTSSCTYSPDPLTAGLTSVTASYTEGATTKTASVSGLTVSAIVLNSISIKTAASKTSFKLGETFSSGGLVINANYNNGTVEVTSGFAVSGVDTAVLGAQTATITYESKTTTYAVDVTNQGASVGNVPNITELFISEYYEGASNDKYIEIYNGTSSSIALTTDNYRIKIDANGAGTWASLDVALTGSIPAHGTYLFAHSSSNASILALANQTTGSGMHNGDDSIGLFKGANLIDLFGVFGDDPGASWDIGATTGATADHVVVRKNTVVAPVSTWNTEEWDVYANSLDYAGSHTVASADVTPTEQATAFANYVMTGIGNNAQGNCAAVKSELDAEYAAMSDPAKAEYNTNSGSLFVDARARMAYLTNWVAAQSPSGVQSTPDNTSKNALIASAVIGILGLTTVSGFYFLKKKKETF